MKNIVEDIKNLESLRKSNVMLYFGQDQAPFPKPIEDEDVAMFFSCLKQMGHVDRLDLVLHTYGGSVVHAQKISHLLREYTHHFNVLVPYKARSAGTLLCLGSESIVMSALSELGPLDAQIHAAASTGMPTAISSEDIQSFIAMAQEWFHIKKEEQGIHLLKLLTEHFFPTTLASFFRAEALMKTMADDLLRFHLPPAKEQQKAAIISRLVNGYHDHSYAIGREECRDIGLNVVNATKDEEAYLYSLLDSCMHMMQKGVQSQTVDGVMMTGQICAYHLVEWIPEVTAGSEAKKDAATRVSITQNKRLSYWKIVAL